MKDSRFGDWRALSQDILLIAFFHLTRTPVDSHFVLVNVKKQPRLKPFAEHFFSRCRTMSHCFWPNRLIYIVALTYTWNGNNFINDYNGNILKGQLAHIPTVQ